MPAGVPHYKLLDSFLDGGPKDFFLVFHRDQF